eukprot:667775-Prymnesium_polylepis.1
MGLAGYIMARSNSAHKLPEDILEEMLAVKIMLRLSLNVRKGGYGDFSRSQPRVIDCITFPDTP